MSITIELNFFYRIKEIDRFKLSFQENLQFIKEEKMKFSIPEYIFNNGKDKGSMSIKLFQIGSENSIESKFHVYYGENKAYVQLDMLCECTYEIILRNKSCSNISLLDKNFTELDSIGNKNFKRLVLINYGHNFLTIDNINYCLSDIIKDNCYVKNKSYQISELDIKEKKFIVKPFEEKDEFDIQFLKKNMNHINSFKTELDNLFFSEEKDYYSKINDMKNNYNYIKNYSSLNLNRTIEYLNHLFQNTFLNTNLFINFFLCLFFIDNVDKFVENRKIIESFISKIMKIADEICLLKNLPIYDKIRAINALFFTINDFSNVETLNSLNLRFVVFSEKEPNSIMDKVEKFFMNFIDKLSDESIIFRNLLYLDGGYGFYNNEIVYTFDLTNLDMVKSHLKDIFPKILIFYNIKNEEFAFNAPEFGGIVINEYNLLEKKGFKEVNYNSFKNIFINEEEQDEISMNLTLYIFHESFGHIKFALIENGMRSPNKIINKDNELIELKYEQDYNSKKEEKNFEFILTSNNKKGDSGHFLELGYGTYENQLITKLLLNFERKGKLINRPDLFAGDGKILKEYVILRKKAEKNNIELSFESKMSIEEEISKMKLIINQFEENNKKQLLFDNHKNNEFEKKSNLFKKRKGSPIDYYNRRENKNKKDKNCLNNYDMKEKENYNKEKNNIDESKEKSWNEKKLELFRTKTNDEIVEIIKNRVFTKFNLKEDAFIYRNMRKKIKELKNGDPYFDDLAFLIGQMKKKV